MSKSIDPMEGRTRRDTALEPHPAPIVSMSLRPGIPWRVALPQSPPPLPRLRTSMHYGAGKANFFSANGNLSLILWPHQTTALQAAPPPDDGGDRRRSSNEWLWKHENLGRESPPHCPEIRSWWLLLATPPNEMSILLLMRRCGQRPKSHSHVIRKPPCGHPPRMASSGRDRLSAGPTTDATVAQAPNGAAPDVAQALSLPRRHSCRRPSVQNYRGRRPSAISK